MQTTEHTEQATKVQEKPKGKPKREVRISVYMSPVEYDAATETAAQLGLSISAAIRFFLFQELIYELPEDLISKKPRVLRFLVTEEEGKKIRLGATQRGMSISEFAKYSLAKSLHEPVDPRFSRSKLGRRKSSKANQSSSNKATLGGFKP